MNLSSLFSASHLCFRNVGTPDIFDDGVSGSYEERDGCDGRDGHDDRDDLPLKIQMVGLLTSSRPLWFGKRGTR